MRHPVIGRSEVYSPSFWLINIAGEMDYTHMSEKIRFAIKCAFLKRKFRATAYVMVIHMLVIRQRNSTKIQCVVGGSLGIHTHNFPC